MGRSSKQRTTLKAKRMMSSDESKELLNAPHSDKIKSPIPTLTVGKVFPLLGSSNVFDLIPFSKKSEGWTSYVPFTSSKSTNYFGFAFYNEDFSRCFVMGFAKADHRSHPNDGDFTSMFGYTYKDIQDTITTHILRISRNGSKQVNMVLLTL